MNMSHHDHSGHNMMGMTTDATGHSGHNMSMMGTSTVDPHAGHDMSNMGTENDPHAGHDMGGMPNHMMKMYFHTGLTEYVLFENCETSDRKEMIIACVVIFFVAVLYEGLKFVREVLLQKSMRSRSQSYYVESTTGSPANSQEKMVNRSAESSVLNQMMSCSHVIQTILHVIQVFVSYCLMLVFMTYNVWLCVAVILGAGVGYFVFGWKRAVVVDSNEHCH